MAYLFVIAAGSLALVFVLCKALAEVVTWMTKKTIDLIERTKEN